MPEITLALGGGGSKGFAHLGVLRVLEEQGYRVRAVTGTSAGAIIGALYAAGYNAEEVTAWVESVPERAFQRHPDDGPSLMGLAGVEAMLRQALEERTFADLPIPFGAVAVDIFKGRTVYLRRGLVVEAVLASSAVPGIFPPRERNGRLLVDGGVMDNVPVRLARLLAPHLPVVAVSLTPPPERLGDPTGVRMLAKVPILNQLAGRLRLGQAFNIFLRAIDIGGAWMTHIRLQLDQPEVLITPDVAQVGLLDQVDIRAVAAIGEVAAREALPQLEAATSTWAAWRRRLKPTPLNLNDVEVL